MPIETLQLQGINVIVVYKALDVSAAAIDDLKRLVPDPPPPVVQIPGQLLLIPYSNGVQLQLANRRLVLSEPKSRDVSHSRIPAMFGSVVAAAGQDEVVAYGFNYDAVATLSDATNTAEAIMDRFLGDSDEIESLLEASLQRVKIELTYDVEGQRHSLRIEPSDAADEPGVHLNVHYAEEELLTREELLEQRMQCHYERLVRTLNSIFSQ